MATVHHGVLLRVDGCGVLINGLAGSGKSSLALALIGRGHALVADDAPELTRQGQTVRGHCPSALQDLLYTRSLGVVNIRLMYGDAAICDAVAIDCCITLTNAVSAAPNLDGSWSQRELLGIAVPALALLPNRIVSPAIEVEAAARALRSKARAADTLRARQSAAMQATACN